MAKGGANPKQQELWLRFKKELAKTGKDLKTAADELKKNLDKVDALAQKEGASDKVLAKLVKESGVKYKFKAR